MEIHLIRHTKVNVQTGICYGQSDVNLAETFDSELENLNPKLDSTYDLIISSPLKRCTLLAQQLDLGEIKTDQRLKEINFGSWELKSWNEIDPTEIDNWHTNLETYKNHAGENLLELQQRVHQFIEELITENHKKILLVTHAGVIRLFYQYILQFPVANTMKYPIQFGQVHNMNISKDPSFCFIKEIR